MSRLMPGRIRQEGIALYEQGKVHFQKQEEQELLFRVDGSSFHYAVTDGKLHCDCEFFVDKGYCAHLAAVEYFLKNHPEGKELTQSLQASLAEAEQQEEQLYEGGLFLDRLVSEEPLAENRYRLIVEGQLLPYDHQIDWTFKLHRFSDSRSYIIRDIAAFLGVLRDGKPYQIGRHYDESLRLSEFDPASQEVLYFLQRLFPWKRPMDADLLPSFGRLFRLPAYAFEEGVQLFSQLEEFSLRSSAQTYHRLEIRPLLPEDALYQFRISVHTHFIQLEIVEPEAYPLFGGRFLLQENRLYVLDPQQLYLREQLLQIEGSEGSPKQLQMNFKDQAKLALSLLEFEHLGTVHAPERFQIRDFVPEFHLDRLASKSLLLEVVLDFEGIRVSDQETLEALPFMSHYLHLQRIRDVLTRNGFHGFFQAQTGEWSDQDLYVLFTEMIPQLRSLGRLYLGRGLSDVMIQERSQLSISTQANLLDVSFDFASVPETEIDQAVQALMNQEGYYQDREGRLHLFDEETKRLSKTLLEMRARYGQGAHIQLDRLSSYRLAQELEGHGQVQFSREFREMAHHLAYPDTFHIAKPPVNATLRPYQESGLRWLSMLDHYGFGGILADDMGLGKTLQTISFLASRWEEGKRVLILAPSSLIYNWKDEFQKFAPDLDTTVVYGHKEERMSLLKEGSSILITSYASFRQDFEVYRQQQFDYLILDEAQVMKNDQTKIAHYLREFEGGTCFALSGTPIENRLSEIWSIFQIVLPGLLPGKREFNRLSPEEVARTIRPFVLRRKKEEVLVDLPDLIEVNVLNELTDPQKAIYLAQLRQLEERVVGATDAELHRRKLEILSGITRLRQICDTPALFLDDYRGGSGKLESLKELLVQLTEGGHRILIFSQFKHMLTLIGQAMDELGISHYQLTGSTPAHDRQTMTRAFNAGSRDAFLISLKAGGVGLNLTGADAVVLVDLWWNPAIEEQAVSRAHRMGQQKTVEFYRLITRGSIEEKILSLQESKRDLATVVLDGNEERSQMTLEDIRDILGISS